MRNKIVQALNNALELLTRQPEQKDNKKIFTDIMHIVDQLESRTIAAEAKGKVFLEENSGRIRITKEHEIKYERFIKQNKILIKDNKQLFKENNKYKKKLARIEDRLYNKWKKLKKWIKRRNK